MLTIYAQICISDLASVRSCNSLIHDDFAINKTGNHTSTTICVSAQIHQGNENIIGRASNHTNFMAIGKEDIAIPKDVT